MTDPYSRPEPVEPTEAMFPPAIPPAQLPATAPGLPVGLPVPAHSGEPPLLAIGDITVTRTSVIVPQGRFPLRGTTWTVQDSTQVSETIPAYAIVLAIVFAVFCLLGLLFLLIKETRYAGFISVTVVGDGLYHSVQMPPGPHAAGWVAGQVNQARALAAAA